MYKRKSPFFFFVHIHCAPKEMNKIFSKNLHIAHSTAVEYNMEVTFFCSI